jgi:predicted kinase
MIIITGIPGSGKSTLAKKRFPNYTRINLDTLKSRIRERAEILRALQAGESVVVDNTNTTAASRKRYLDIAKSFGIPVRSIYLKCPLEVALKRNKARKGKERVPAFVPTFYFRKLEPPSVEEGFGSCEVVAEGNDDQTVIE